MNKKPCRVCAGIEPGTVDRLLVLGRSPRSIAPNFGLTRKDVARHRDTCLVGERRAKVAEDLQRIANEAGGEDT